jgi:hypothetical protein
VLLSDYRRKTHKSVHAHITFVLQELRTALESEKAAFLRIIKSDRAAYEERATQAELLAMTTAQQLQRAVSFLEELTQHAEQQKPLPPIVADSTVQQQQQQQQQPLAAVKAAVQQMRADCTHALQLTTADVTAAAACRKPRRPSTTSKQQQKQQQRPQLNSALC